MPRPVAHSQSQRQKPRDIVISLDLLGVIMKDDFSVSVSDQHLTICICEYVFRLSCNRVLSGGVSWLRTVAPNIHPNVDGEVAYAAPINGLAVGYIQV